MRAKTIGAITILLLSLSAAATEQRKYIMLGDDGVKAGEQIVTIAEDGEIDVYFIYRNNGRGPELQETIRLNEDGTIASYSSKGASTFGSPISEAFSVNKGIASWRAGSKEGSTSITGNPMYMPVEGTFEITSIAIAAMAKSGKNSLPLLPSGTLKQSVVTELEVGLDGKVQTIQLLVQTGLGLEPSFVWATKGDSPRLFASIAPGSFTFIEEGWQTNGEKMAAIQHQQEIKLLEQRAAELPIELNGLTVVQNARIFNSVTKQLEAPSDIYVLRGKITTILPTGQIAAKVDNRIDADGRVVLPGLFDMHGHISRWEGLLHLAAGVTSLRDMGNDNKKLQSMMSEIEQGKLLGPSIFPTGFLEGESPFSARIGFVISDFSEAQDAINWYATHGYHQLKIYNSFPKEILKETVAYAHSMGMRVSGHVPAFLKAEDAIAAGFDEIQHINQLVLNFLVQPDTDTRTLDRFYLPAREFAKFDMNGKAIQDFIALLKSHNMSVDPTLATFDFLKRVDGVAGDPFQPIVDHLPPDLQRLYRTAEVDIPNAETAKLYAKSYAKMVEMVGMMYRAGVPIVAGTDELAGFTLQGELELLVKAGLSPSEALQVATLNGAKFSHASQSKGQIAVGYDADLLLVDGDPTKNISDIRQLALVITQGKALSPTKIYHSIGIVPFVEKIPKVERVNQNTKTGQSSGARSVSHNH